MPASVLTVHVRLSRGCPACGESRCINPEECLTSLVSGHWGNCAECLGSGWGEGLSPFCEWCFGSGLDEYAPTADLAQSLTDHAKAQLDARVTDLRARLVAFPAPLAVAA
ncbi:hypothetical protein SAMN05216489_04874 [Streptomyces sp. 3213]|uniref:hypothetical protein n=1 Tax=Streptomyces sp. 3213.3 TaxID=1855348 RepID=UPI00089B5FB3|nr:hypothetical protein [Streptomyces sp. 3213.3]SED90872.1 hypothetical protein SAMN05216489_04874 [Streptomyces sp. 3213] [Streptomyces sp. 3213.3]